MLYYVLHAHINYSIQSSLYSIFLSLINTGTSVCTVSSIILRLGVCKRKLAKLYCLGYVVQKMYVHIHL